MRTIKPKSAFVRDRARDVVTPFPTRKQAMEAAERMAGRPWSYRPILGPGGFMAEYSGPHGSFLVADD